MSKRNRRIYKFLTPLFLSRPILFIYSRLNSSKRLRKTFKLPQISSFTICRMRNYYYSVFGTAVNLLGESVLVRFKNTKAPKKIIFFKDDTIIPWERYQHFVEKLDCEVVVFSEGLHADKRIYWEKLKSLWLKTPKIEFQDVSYKYPSRDTQVLQDLSFKINPGEVAAFVGPSGSGKTTIIHLLLRFFDPISGRVEVDGHDMLDLSTTDLRAHMGLVTQDTILFDDTVYGNITIGMPGASMDEVVDAAKAADAHAFITAMPQGYDTRLGERGIKLSGGQRQRLAIARAIIKKPKILLLDEATSNLDTASEQAVQGAIERILAGRTVIMVAHRLSTVKNADKIFVLKKGELAETGTHDQLLALGGVYKGLYEAQT